MKRWERVLWVLMFGGMRELMMMMMMMKGLFKTVVEVGGEVRLKDGMGLLVTRAM